MGVGVLVAAACAALRSPAESAAYREIALTRSYWFLARWSWYELAGLAAPLAILAVIARQRRRAETQPMRSERSRRWQHLPGRLHSWLRDLCARRLGFSSCRTAAAFANLPHRLSGDDAILWGRCWESHVFKRRLWRWCGVVLVLGGTMFAAARASFLIRSIWRFPGGLPLTPGSGLHLDSQQHAEGCAVCTGCRLRQHAGRGCAMLPRHRPAKCIAGLLEGWRRGLHRSHPDAPVD